MWLWRFVSMFFGPVRDPIALDREKRRREKEEQEEIELAERREAFESLLDTPPRTFRTSKK